MPLRSKTAAKVVGARKRRYSRYGAREYTGTTEPSGHCWSALPRTSETSAPTIQANPQGLACLVAARGSPKLAARSPQELESKIRNAFVGGQKQMVIADRLRALREGKKLSQGDIEKRSGLLRCYISRVENGHTVPTVGTLEKRARALEVPLYRLQAFLRWRGSAETGKPSQAQDSRRDCVGKLRQGRAVPLTFPKARGACRREGQKTPD